MKLISFDQSSRCTGVTCFVDNKWQWSRVIDLHKNTNTDERMKQMIRAIYEVIDTERPDIVAFEQVANQSNVKTVIMLAQLQGTIIGKCTELGIPYSIIEPAKWRKAVCIEQGKKKRTELKFESLALAHELFDESLSEDAAESSLIGLAYLILNGYSTLEEFKDAALWRD